MYMHKQQPRDQATGYTHPRRIYLSLLAIREAYRHKLITSFTQTKVVSASFKATRPQKLSPLVTTVLLGVNITIR